MHKRIISIAIAAAMATVQVPPRLATRGFQHLAGGSTGKLRSSGKRIRRTTNRNAHQGQKECARRLRVGSAAWYSAKT